MCRDRELFCHKPYRRAQGVAIGGALKLAPSASSIAAQATAARSSKLGATIWTPRGKPISPALVCRSITASFGLANARPMQ
jgi:hypothetical protein